MMKTDISSLKETQLFWFINNNDELKLLWYNAESNEFDKIKERLDQLFIYSNDQLLYVFNKFNGVHQKEKNPVGRKKVEDKKMPIAVYVNESKINALGGKEELRGVVINTIDKMYNEKINSLIQ